MKPILKICNKGWSRPGGIIKNDRHPWWEIVYVVKGRCYFQLDGDREGYGLSEGGAIVVRPGVVHSVKSDPASGYLCFWLLIDYREWKIFPKKIDVMEIPIQDRFFLEILLGKLLEYNSFYFHPKSAQGIVDAIVGFLEDELYRTKKGNKARKRYKYLKVINAYQKILQTIEEEYRRPLSLSYIAGKTDLSSFRVSHLFKELSGMSFSKYLLYYRINVAKSLLLTNISDSVKKIAYMSGFNKLNYFYMQFRKTVGASPNRFRELNYKING